MALGMAYRTESWGSSHRVETSRLDRKLGQKPDMVLGLVEKTEVGWGQ